MDIQEKLKSFLQVMERKLVEVKPMVAAAEKEYFLKEMEQRFLAEMQKIENEIEERYQEEYADSLSPAEVEIAIAEARVGDNWQRKTTAEQVALFENAGVEVTAFRRKRIRELVELGNFDEIHNMMLDLILAGKSSKVKVKDPPRPNLDNASASDDGDKMEGDF